MKNFLKKLTKITITTLLCLLLILALLAAVQMLFLTGTPSDEIWSDTETFDPSTVSQLVKQDGEDFTILLLADIQLGASISKDNAALAMMDELVDETNPDFIMTTGDNGYFILADFMAGRVISRLESYGIPWSTTLGNHDTEALASRNWMGNQYENAENSLFQMGPDNVSGVGNYIINVADTQGNVIYSLIVMDSNVRRDYEDGKDYDYIHEDQIQWYDWAVAGQPGVPSMLFFHIPLPEYAEAAALLESGDLADLTAFGANHETVCCPPYNSGLFDKILELQSTTHVFVGHDHINSLSVTYQGVRLTYALKTGPTCYYEDEMQGATLITIVDGTNEVLVENIYK